MSSLPNEFNPYGDRSMNHTSFVPIQTTRNESQTVRSMFPTNENTNLASFLFSSSPPFTSTSHHSPVLSSSLRFNDSRMGNQMRGNKVPNVRLPRTPQISGFSTCQMSPALITGQTFPNRYNHAIVPTNNVVNVQNRHERAKRVMTSEPPIWSSPSFRPTGFDNQWETTYPQPVDYSVSQQASTSRQNLDLSSLSPKRAKPVMTSEPPIWNSPSVRPNSSDNPWETTYPPPIDYFVSQQASTSRQTLDLSSLTPNHHGEQEDGLEDGRPVKKIRTETDFRDYIDYEEGETSDDSEDDTSDDSEDEGPTNSLLNQNYGSYTCPTCNTLFDTSPLSAARMGLVHSGRNETSEERTKGLRARAKEAPW